MRPFNINEVNQGDVIPTKDGKHTVRILCTDCAGSYPIIGLVNGTNYKNHDQKFKADGTNMWNDDDDDFDLVLPDLMESVDVFIYRSSKTNKLYAANCEDFYNHLIKKVTIQI